MPYLRRRGALPAPKAVWNLLLMHRSNACRGRRHASRSTKARPALTMLPYRRVYCAMITPLVVVTLLVSSNSVSGAGPSNSRAPLPRVSGHISSV